MAKYRLNLSFDIDIKADEEEETSEEEMVKMLQELYYNDKTELLATLRYYFEKDKSFLEMNMKLLVMISMLVGIMTLLLRYSNAH